MFEIGCTYRPSPDGFQFFPDDPDTPSQCELRVTFLPLAWYPAEPDIGAGSDFDAKIIAIDLFDWDRPYSGGWRRLEGAERAAAEVFLEAHHHDDMWAQAEDETAEAFGASNLRRAA